MNTLFSDLERRSEVLQARVTPRERAMVETEARQRGLTVSELTRAALGAFLTAGSTPTGEVTSCPPAQS